MGGCCKKNKPIIVTLCGSTKFGRYFHEKNAELTKHGYIVLTPGIFHHTNETTLASDEKNKLDILHKKKIAMSDYIYVLNIGGYIGSSTQSEIAYARSIGVTIEYHYGIAN